MSYDLHGTWDSTNKFLGSYIAAHTNLTEINIALSLLWRNNINPGNVVLGLGFYGRSFTLADPSCTTAGCVFTSGASGGQCTQSVGTLSYAEIQRIIAQGATVTKDDNAAVKMVVYNTNQWVSYDDEETLKMKVDYANAHCLGGTMVWAASTDDAKGSAASSLSKETGRQSISLLPSTLASVKLTFFTHFCTYSGNNRTTPLLPTSHGESKHLRVTRHVQPDKGTTQNATPKLLRGTLPTFYQTISTNVVRSAARILHSYCNNYLRLFWVETKPTSRCLWPPNLIRSMVIDLMYIFRTLVVSTMTGGC